MKKITIMTFVLVQLVLLFVLQMYFYNLQEIGSEKTKTIIDSLLKYEKINHNPYTLSESLQTLEQSGVIRCTTLSLSEDEYIYFNTFKKDQCQTSFVNLRGKVLNLKLKSISGIVWNIKTISLNSDSFESTLMLSRFFVFLIQIFIYFAFYLFDKNKRLQIELMNAEALTYQQVSHDIRSPMFVVRSLLNSHDFSEKNVEILKAAFVRLDSILQDTRLKGASTIILEEEFELGEMLSEIVTEKELINKSKGVIEINIEKNHLYYVQTNKSQMQRMVSNLLNNSIEAASGEYKIVISIKPSAEYVKIIIHDNGKGFPLNLLSKIGKERVSFGKNDHADSGTGLGLLHACRFIDKAGGKIIFSNKEVGAVVEILIKLKRVDSITSSYDYLYIEDDEMMCFLWTERAKKQNVKLKVINHPKHFELIKDQIGKETQIYCDSDFQDTKGEELLEELYEMGYRNLFLTTGYSKEKFNPGGRYKILEKTIPF